MMADWSSTDGPFVCCIEVARAGVGRFQTPGGPARLGWPCRVHDALFEQRFALLVGPLEGTRDALLILRASSPSEIAERIAADLWTSNGLLITKQISPWQLRLGSLG